MEKRTYELLREGEWSVDGRMLTPDTVVWNDPIPVIARGVGYDGHIVGAMTNIRREDNKILGDTDVTIGAHMAFTCDTDLGTAVEHEAGRVELTGVRLRAANVNEAKYYPWKDA